MLLQIEPRPAGLRRANGRCRLVEHGCDASLLLG
jgi:hypothetical protein